MADIYIEHLPNTGNPQFDLAARRIIDLLRTYISSFDTNEVTGGDAHDHSGSVGFKRKIVNIGDWDMDASTSVTVAHGLTLSKIRNVAVMIVDDAGTTNYLLPAISSVDGIAQAFILGTSGTDITLGRLGSGGFDNTSFNATSYNRGWVVIEYID